MILASTLITGVKYPKVAASLCGVWSVCRVLYTIGYSTGIPKKVCVAPPLSTIHL